MSLHPLKPGTRWRYAVPEFGAGAIHTVTSVDERNDCVTTWSEPFQRADIGGQSWMGPIADFARRFTPLGPPLDIK